MHVQLSSFNNDSFYSVRKIVMYTFQFFFPTATVICTSVTSVSCSQAYMFSCPPMCNSTTTYFSPRVVRRDASERGALNIAYGYVWVFLLVLALSSLKCLSKWVDLVAFKNKILHCSLVLTNDAWMKTILSICYCMSHCTTILLQQSQSAKSKHFNCLPTSNFDQVWLKYNQ